MQSTHHEWIAVLIFLPFTGYLQYRCIRDFWPEIVRTLKTRKVRGHLLGATGLFFFFLSMQLLMFVPWSVQRWGGPLVLGTIVLTVTGFVIGNQTIGRIPKKYTNRVAKSNDRQAP